MLSIFNWFQQRKKITALCIIMWAVIILAACLIPSKDVPSLSIFQYDKLVHFGIFGLLSFLMLLYLKNPRLVPQGLWVWIICTVYGYFIELLQGSGITEGRSYDGFDELADSFGAGLGVLIFFLFHFLNTRFKKD
ncbi:MAG TPA: VanZ family protein [Edaphocola sp.]|nr:VanZ family protein [Edaphocola sp.]